MPLWIANGTDSQNGERVLTVPFGYGVWPFLARSTGWRFSGPTCGFDRNPQHRAFRPDQPGRRTDAREKRKG